MNTLMNYLQYIPTFDMNSFLLMTFVFLFIFVFWKEHKNPKSNLVWTDLIIDPKTNKASVTRLGQFWGIFLSGWIMIFLTQKIPADKIADMYAYLFGIWLAFLVGSYSMSNFFKMKTEEKEKEK